MKPFCFRLACNCFKRLLFLLQVDNNTAPQLPTMCQCHCHCQLDFHANVPNVSEGAIIKSSIALEAKVTEDSSPRAVQQSKQRHECALGVCANLCNFLNGIADYHQCQRPFSRRK